MKFLFSFVLVLFNVSCSGLDAGLETPPQQQIKEIQQKSGQQIKEIQQKTEQQIEQLQQESGQQTEQETKEEIEQIKQENKVEIEKIQKETIRQIEQVQKETKTPSQQQTKPQELPTSASPAPPSFAKQLEQITGVYHKKVDVYWLWYPYDFWKADLSTKIVLAYSPNSDTLMFWIRSMDADDPGRFCTLLSNFSIAGFEPDYTDDEGHNGSTLTVYEAKYLKSEWKEELQHNSIDDYRQGLKEDLNQVGDADSTTRFISLFVTDTGELESMTVYMFPYMMFRTIFKPAWFHSGVEPIRFKSSERSSEEIPSDPEAFFSEQLNKSPCRFIDKSLW